MYLKFKVFFNLRIHTKRDFFGGSRKREDVTENHSNKKEKNGTICRTIFTPFKELIIFRKHQTPEFTHSVSQM
jgi:hypothetical protein